MPDTRPCVHLRPLPKWYAMPFLPWNRLAIRCMFTRNNQGISLQRSQLRDAARRRSRIA